MTLGKVGAPNAAVYTASKARRRATIQSVHYHEAALNAPSVSARAARRC